MYEELTYNEALDLTNKHASKIDAGQMFTLADLYFATAHDALAVKEMRDLAAGIQKFYRNSGKPSS